MKMAPTDCFGRGHLCCSHRGSGSPPLHRSGEGAGGGAFSPNPRSAWWGGLSLDSALGRRRDDDVVEVDRGRGSPRDDAKADPSLADRAVADIEDVVTVHGDL